MSIYLISGSGFFKTASFCKKTYFCVAHFLKMAKVTSEKTGSEREIEHEYTIFAFVDGADLIGH
jgi:hypothetical protein